MRLGLICRKFSSSSITLHGAGALRGRPSIALHDSIPGADPCRATMFFTEAKFKVSWGDQLHCLTKSSNGRTPRNGPETCRHGVDFMAILR